MKRRVTWFALLGMAVIALLFIYKYQSNSSSKPKTMEATPDMVPSHARPPSSSQLAPSRQSDGRSLSAAHQPHLARDLLLSTNDLRDALQKLLSSDSIPLPEKLFYKAVILEGCSQYNESLTNSGPEIAEAAKSGTMDQLNKLALSLAKTDAQRKAMTYSLQRKTWNACKGFANTHISRDEIERAYADAAAAGQPAAKARMVAAEIARSGAKNAANVPAQYRDVASTASEPVGFPDPISQDAQRELLNAMFSGDPIAIRTAGQTLSLGTDQQSFRFGPDGVDLGVHSDLIWTLAACDFGFECGERNMLVNLGCAEQVRCAPDLIAYLHDYALKPDEYAWVESNARAIADAIRRHDTSAFQLVNQPGRGRTLLGGPLAVSIR